MRLIRFALPLLTAALVACGGSPPAPAPAAEAPRKYLLERVDDAAVVQLYADGFASLPLKEKTLIWHLSQAAIAGRDIYYDQKSPSRTRDAGRHRGDRRQPAGVDPKTLAAIEEYAKLFWINNGPYNNLTAQKFLLASTPEALSAAVKAADPTGAALALKPGETLDALLATLQPMFFDAAFEPQVTAKTPKPGQDILTASQQQPVCRRLDEGPRRIQGDVPAQLAAGEAGRQAHRGALSHRRRCTTRRSPPSSRISRPPGRSPRHPMAKALDALIAVVSHGQRRRSARVRHRLGRGQGVAGRHHQRLHRGLSRRARREGRVGGRGLLRQPREDRAASRSSPPRRSGSRTACPGIRSTGRRA